MTPLHEGDELAVGSVQGCCVFLALDNEEKILLDHCSENPPLPDNNDHPHHTKLVPLHLVDGVAEAHDSKLVVHHYDSEVESHRPKKVARSSRLDERKGVIHGHSTPEPRDIHEVPPVCRVIGGIFLHGVLHVAHRLVLHDNNARHTAQHSTDLPVRRVVGVSSCRIHIVHHSVLQTAFRVALHVLARTVLLRKTISRHVAHRFVHRVVHSFCLHRICRVSHHYESCLPFSACDCLELCRPGHTVSRV